MIAPFDESPDDDDSADFEAESDSSSEWPYAEVERDDFPPEEEDEDNPDWYRVADPGGHAAKGGSSSPTAAEAAEEDDDWEDDAVGDGPPREPAPTSPPPSGLSLFFDDKGYYAYVLASRSPTAFSEKDAPHLQNALLKAGIEVTKAGRSFQPASNDAQYDWYLRVRTLSGEKPSTEAVLRALDSFVGVKKDREADPRIPQLERLLARAVAELAAAEERAVDAKKESDAVRVSERDLRDRIEALRAQMETQRLRASETESVLVDRLAQAVAARRADRPNDDLEVLIAHLKDALVEQRAIAAKHAVAAEARSKELTDYIAHFDAELDRTKREELTLRQRIEHLQRQLATPALSAAAPKSKAGLKSIVVALLPQVRFHGGSFDILHKELPDPMPALSLIGEVLWKGAHRAEKAVVSASPWRRIHFRTGTSDDGRLYYARNRSTSQLEVLVSRKGQQQEDLAFLRSIALA